MPKSAVEREPATAEPRRGPGKQFVPSISRLTSLRASLAPTVYDRLLDSSGRSGHARTGGFLSSSGTKSQSHLAPLDRSMRRLQTLDKLSSKRAKPGLAQIDESAKKRQQRAEIKRSLSITG